MSGAGEINPATVPTYGLSAEPDTGDVEALANTALSVWSNTCNAYCSEEDRAHEPECLLAAGLHRTAARIARGSR